MENLQIKGSKGVYYIPTVDFNADTGVCELAGESFLEDTESFYSPIYDWLRTYTSQVNKPLTFNISLTYYNTSSSRSILTIFKILKEYKLNGGDVSINWYLNEDKELIEEIEDFRIESELNINIIRPKKS